MIDEAADEIHLQGSSLSKGIAIGKLYFLESFQEDVPPEFPVARSEIEKEINRYRSAIHSSRDDLHNLQNFLAKEGSKEAVSIIGAHIQMLEDPFMTTFMEKKIRQMMKNTESVFRSVMGDYELEFSKVKNSVIRERLLDVKDLSERILCNLYPRKRIILSDIPKNSVVFTKELIPSCIAENFSDNVKGFISEVGGSTSHATLIVRSKGLPLVSNIDTSFLASFENSLTIVDGRNGEIIINPKKETLESFIAMQKIFEERRSNSYDSAQTVMTSDGQEVNLLVNLDVMSDLDFLDSSGVKGIGLFRSEFFFFGKELSQFSEEEQFRLYKKVMEQSSGIPVTFRVFDIGGDKGRVHATLPEPNPALGCRGIRFLLQNPDIFKTQLRALLRVSLQGDLRILLPLISDVDELLAAKALIYEVASDLRLRGYEIAEEIALGCMVEVPSAAILCDLIAKECDFLSIGTNDLIQYTLASDRTGQQANSFYKSFHPSIIRMIRHIVTECNRLGKPVNLCGEMASDPLATPLLLGLGIRNFSCCLRFIPHIRKMIQMASIKEVEELALEIMSFETTGAIETHMKKKFQDRIDSL